MITMKSSIPWRGGATIPKYKRYHILEFPEISKFVKYKPIWIFLLILKTASGCVCFIQNILFLPVFSGSGKCPGIQQCSIDLLNGTTHANCPSNHLSTSVHLLQVKEFDTNFTDVQQSEFYLEPDSEYVFQVRCRGRGRRSWQPWSSPFVHKTPQTGGFA